MNYRINYNISGNFLKAEITGEYPISKFFEISAKMDEVIDANGIDKILVDLRGFIGRYGVFDGLERIENFREESRYLQFAILDRLENKPNNDFFENASFNRGFKLLFFYIEEEAYKWLDVIPGVEYQKTLVKEY